MGKPLAQAAERTLFANLFAGIAEEMGATLTRTAYSPNIKERRDSSTAVFDARGTLVAQAACIPVHLGAMPLSVQAAIQAFDRFRPGDVVMLNDPFRGGTHLPDITMVSPVFADDRGKRPVAFLASRAHHADVGGMTPGSMPLSTEVFQEGLRLPPVKLYDAGMLNQGLMDTLLANVRTPRERRGDVRAQLAAHRVGEARYQEALQRFGESRLTVQAKDLLAYGEDLMEALLTVIPDGCYRFTDHLDGDGLGSGPLAIRVSVTLRGSRATVDFTGSALQCRGGLNAVLAITRSAVDYCFLGLLMTPGPHRPAMPQDLPLNGGCFRSIRVIAPEGTVVNANPPAGVAAGNVETSQRIVDVVLGALAQALPNVVPAAGQGTMNNLTLGGVDPRTGEPFAYYETLAGGMGASAMAPGAHGVQVHMTNTLNTPVEALEFAYPLRVERHERRKGSGGKGRHAGGDGLQKDVRLLCEAGGTLLAERHTTQPYGLAGGKPGDRGQAAVVRGGKKSRLSGKAHLHLQPGDVLHLKTPGGGGWGKPGKKS